MIAERRFKLNSTNRRFSFRWRNRNFRCIITCYPSVMLASVSVVAFFFFLSVECELHCISKFSQFGFKGRRGRADSWFNLLYGSSIQVQRWISGLIFKLSIGGASALNSHWKLEDESAMKVFTIPPFLCRSPSILTYPCCSFPHESFEGKILLSDYCIALLSTESYRVSYCLTIKHFFL